MRKPSSGVNESAMTPGAADALARAGFSRRAFIKGTGALIVSFSMGGALATLEAQNRGGAFGGNVAPGSPPTNEVDSWIAIGSDGGVTAYTGKEELGQGMSTAQTQLVAEELCVPFHRVNLIACDTSITPDQGVTSGSQSHPANFNHANLAGACATAREALLQLGSKKLNLPAEELIAVDGTIRSKSEAARKSPTRNLWPERNSISRWIPPRNANPRASGPCSESPSGGRIWPRWPQVRSSMCITCAGPGCCTAW